MSKNYPSFVCYPMNKVENFEDNAMNSETSYTPMLISPTTELNTTPSAIFAPPTTELNTTPSAIFAPQETGLANPFKTMNYPLGISVQMNTQHNPDGSPKADGSRVCVDDTCFDTNDFKNILKTLITLSKNFGGQK